MRVLTLAFVLSFASTALADGRVIEIEEPVEIIGTPQRPNAFYVLTRHDGRTEVVDLRTTFTDEIVRDAARVD